MELLNEQEKIIYWNIFYNSKKSFPNGVTQKRLDKLKPIIWNKNDDFWFYVWRKPEDIGFIILDALIYYKIYKPK